MSLNEALLSSNSVLWATPTEFVERLESEFGPFQLDPCCERSTAKAPRYFTPALNGLAQPWSGLVFMNPPYGREIGRWVAKAHNEAQAGATVVALIPARTDTRYWHDHVMLAHEIRFVIGRIRFEIDGKPGDPAPFPSAVVIFRPGRPPRQPIVSAMTAKGESQ